MNVTRQQANLALLQHLTDMINNNPDIRFSQALVNLELVQYLGDHTCVGDYYLEPRDLLKRVEEKKKIVEEYLSPK